MKKFSLILLIPLFIIGCSEFAETVLENNPGCKLTNLVGASSAGVVKIYDCTEQFKETENK